MFDDRAMVWWAGKQLENDKAVGEYAGKNEKTRLIVGTKVGRTTTAERAADRRGDLQEDGAVLLQKGG